MLDPEEMADYETWKERKLDESIDLSYAAYNVEREAAALAWEAGWRARDSGRPFESNEYRGKGTAGERKRKLH